MLKIVLGTNSILHFFKMFVNDSHKLTATLIF